MSASRWERLKARAESAITAAQEKFPPEILAEAKKVPCLFLPCCEEDPELLGQYTDFAENEVSAANGPIILYLETIEDFCAGEGFSFEEEVRTTYLHELGHHFGWDEDDLEARGLG
ncbi:MAG TPA: metallopeptidase family protein [Candidatus Methylacidiphilales bacterium]|nr:metallopeptidase family protein [Candidatus Methylacidiphilales bacterium]